jgi:hypothetical protein
LMKDSQFQTNELKFINFKWLLSLEIKFNDFFTIEFLRESYPIEPWKSLC